MSDSVSFKIAADASGVSLALKQVKADLQELSTADFVMGMDAVLNLFNKLRGAVGALGQMFFACTQEAAALEEVGTRLGVMLNAAAAGDALAASLQRMASNGVVPLEAQTAAAGALVGVFDKPADVAEWVGGLIYLRGVSCLRRGWRS